MAVLSLPYLLSFIFHSRTQGLANAASVLQIIHVGTEVVKRITQHSVICSEVPEVFWNSSYRVASLSDALRLTKERTENENTPGSTRNAFSTIVEECIVQIRKLSP